MWMRRCLLVAVGLMWGVPSWGGEDVCSNVSSDEKQLYWGDLHVHTAWSLDAYAFGSIATPADAYAFAKGQPLRLANGEQVVIDRPLDFAAVTDHSETFDVMFLCTDPGYRDDGYCRAMRDLHSRREGRRIFTDYLLPMITPEVPAPAALCADDEVDCAAASRGQWRRMQEVANQANEPCEFSALIGYEWSASPGGRHWHRNVIFRSASVPDQAFDFIRYPNVARLWQALDDHCLPAEGCDALAIPHNINWADGGGFSVSSESPQTLALRARFERLAEVHQEKGSSECLPHDRASAEDDCAFERLTANFAQQHVGGGDNDSPEDAWARMRSTYYRTLLGEGLKSLAAEGSELNPLKLGAVGSTDSHFGTAGRVQEKGYWGSMSMLWQPDEARISQDGYNPGGLVAVWAIQNTREAIFDALKRREAFATSGPRISLRFGIAPEGACARPGVQFDVPMGGTLNAARAPHFVIMAGRDAAMLGEVQLVKGEVRNGDVVESVHTVDTYPDGAAAVCVEWRDDKFFSEAPAYWYARVIEMPTPRWTKHLCEAMGRCDEFPDADAMVRERAWSSPIWYEPGRD
ncbi:MAG: DUF3604 domain-containing protein [Pseudomonadales bacterium]